MQVARRRAFAGQPLRFGGERADQAGFGRPDHGAAKEAEGRAQAAQRHPCLVDADRPAAFQDDGAIFLEIGVALRHDLPQGRIWWGIGGKRAGHAGPNRSRRRLPGNRK